MKILNFILAIGKSEQKFASLYFDDMSSNVKSARENIYQMQDKKISFSTYWHATKSKFYMNYSK